MKKFLLLLLGVLFLWAGQVNAQWSINTLDTDHTIDFETTVSGVNEGTFDGSGFATTPATGQLNAAAWAVSGMSDGFKDFDVENTTGDLARGTSLGGITSGGIYSFEVETGNYTLGVQPSGSDFAPGWIGLKLQNNTGEVINTINFSYDIWELNNEGRSSTFNGEFSPNGTNWVPITELAYATTEVADAAPVWEKTTLSYTGEMGLDVNDGDFLYFRWYSDDNGGSGGRDEIAIDNLIVNLSIAAPVITLPFYETYESWPLDNWEIEGTGTNVWESNDGTSHGPNSVTEGSLAAMFNVYNTSSGNTTTMTTDVIDMDGVNPTLSFDFWMDGSSDADLWIKAEMTIDGTNWSEIFYQEQDGNISDWTEASVILTGANATTQVRLVASSDYGYYNIFVDNLAIEEISCPKPTALTTTNITTTSADLGWTESGTSTTWNLKVTTASTFDPTTQTGEVFEGVATGNPHALSSLDPSTTYYFYVQTDCGGGDLSDWSNVGMFTTSDIYYPLPISEDFEAGLGNITFVNGTQTNYWMNGPLASQTGNALYVTNDGSANAYNPGSASVSHAYIPVDFNGITNATLSFDWICNGEGSYTYYDYLRVYLVPDTESIDAGTLISSTYQLGETYNLETSLQNASITLTSAEITQDNMKLVFSWRNDGGVGEQPPASVDNITLTAITCFAPTNLTLDANTTTDATFSWTATGTETSWNLIYGPTGFNPTSEGTIVIADESPYTITGLSSGTLYDVYVQANCGIDDLSQMEGPVLLATDCEPYAIPHTENFDTWGTGSDAFPICWTRPVLYTSYSNTFPAIEELSGSPSSPNSLRFMSSTSENTYAVTPAFNEEIHNLMISFAIKLSSSPSAGKLEVGVMSDPNDINTFESVQIIDPGSTDWTSYEVLFASTTLTGTNNYIAFRHIENTSTYSHISIDDLVVDLIPACPNPSELYAENITPTSADLGWTVGLNEDTWNINYGEAGFTVSEGTLITGTMDNPTTVSGLIENTTYEFYVQADCGGTDQSVWIGPYAFHTACDIVAVPFFEGFENNSTTLNCWTALDLDADGYTWALYTTDSYEGNQSIVSRWNSSGNNDWLISPQLAVNADNYVLDFFAKSTSSYSLEDFEVLVSTTGNNPTDFTIMLESITSHPNAWMQHIYKLSDHGINSGDNIYIAIRHTSINELRLLVDAFQVRALSSETDFITYSFPEQTGAANIDYNNFTIEIEVGNGTDVTGLVANFEVSEGATADIAGTTQESGVTANDFTTSVIYTVTAEDGTTTQDWVVNVTVAEIYTETDILTYTFPEALTAATIDATEKTVEIEVAWNADVTALAAEFELSYGATATIAGTDQVSGVTENDFTNPVVYTITAEDGTTTEDWTVTVTLGDVPMGANCENPFLISLPANLPYTDAGQTNCGLGDIYSDTEMGSYDGGEDAIYEITVTSDVVVNIMLDPGTTTWTGIGLFSSCPTTDNLIDQSTNSSASIHGFEEIALSAGTYYILIDIWPSPNCIDSYELSITPGSVLDFANNTTLTLTPETQSIAPGDDANAVLNVVYPETVSASLPTDLMTDALLDLSELTAGAVVELFNAGTSLGTYTVTGGETVWASEAFTSVISVPAYLTEGESINWDVVVSGLAIGTYNVGATLYLGLAADLAAQTNMTEAATDAMQIIVAEAIPEINVIDLNNAVADVAVCLGTDENEAIVLLADVITITDTEDNEFTVSLNWTIDAYDASTPAVYDATGTFELPAGVSQTDPVTVLEVTATVTVNELPVVTCPGAFEVTDITPVTLTATPTGGIYTGTGITGDSFSADGLANGDYTITYTYTDPTTSCENFCDFVITVNIATPNPQIADIDTESDVADIAVCIGTDETTAIASLATEITITDTDATEYIVPLTWTVASYDANTAADYTATGTFELPTGVNQTDPATSLEVTAIVTVNELPIVTCPETMAMTANDDAIVLTGATPEGGVYSGENVTDGEFNPSGLAIGAYAITYTYTDPETGCENSCEFNIDIITGIATLSTENISIYPNPNNGQFIIEMMLVEKQDVILSIFNSNGQIVREMKFDDIDNFTREIDMNNVAEGLYLIRINAGGKMFNSQVVIQ